jgi:hypothetical protein
MSDCFQYGDERSSTGVTELVSYLHVTECEKEC